MHACCWGRQRPGPVHDQDTAAEQLVNRGGLCSDGGLQLGPRAGATDPPDRKMDEHPNRPTVMPAEATLCFLGVNRGGGSLKAPKNQQLINQTCSTVSLPFRSVPQKIVFSFCCLNAICQYAAKE